MNKENNYCIINAVIFGIILNLVLPLLLKPFATDEEIKPSNGAASLSLKGQFMHMMVHHNQVPFMSSVIIAIIVGLSVYLGYIVKPVEYSNSQSGDEYVWYIGISVLLLLLLGVYFCNNSKCEYEQYTVSAGPEPLMLQRSEPQKVNPLSHAEERKRRIQKMDKERKQRYCVGEWSDCSANCKRVWTQTPPGACHAAACCPDWNDRSIRPQCYPGEDDCPKQTDSCPPGTYPSAPQCWADDNDSVEACAAADISGDATAGQLACGNAGACTYIAPNCNCYDDLKYLRSNPGEADDLTCVNFPNSEEEGVFYEAHVPPCSDDFPVFDRMIGVAEGHEFGCYVKGHAPKERAVVVAKAEKEAAGEQ